VELSTGCWRVDVFEILVLVMVGYDVVVWTVERYRFLLRYDRYCVENGLMLLSECVQSVFCSETAVQNLKVELK